jgi:CxxC motif-containing protein (DUF1111 family)
LWGFLIFGGLVLKQKQVLILVSGLIMILLLVIARVQSQDNRATNPLLGGQATVFNETRNAFAQPIPGLERDDELLFFVGNSFFNQNWVTAPSSTTARDGLGATFNSRSCAGCHFKDGRGHAPENGEVGTGFLIRLNIPERSLTGAYLPDLNYGGQLQDQALEGMQAEGQIEIAYTEITGSFADGTSYSLRQPAYSFSELAYGELYPEIRLSPRVANQMIGLGLLEAIPESTILSLADPNDSDGDGISGRPNLVWDVFNQEMAIGRFGWKANQPSLLQQVAGAFIGDIGITTSLFPEENCPMSQSECLTLENGGIPEISDDDLMKVVLYSSVLAVPAQRHSDVPEIQQGEALFAEIGCSACHTMELETGIHLQIPALSNQTIRPFTDLLLHDMGEGLADNSPDFEASGSEWRTAPLWGIGLFETVNGHSFYLHDGRARNIDEAILWHGGEAQASRDAFINLSAEERAALVAFLRSL